MENDFKTQQPAQLPKRFGWCLLRWREQDKPRQTPNDILHRGQLVQLEKDFMAHSQGSPRGETMGFGRVGPSGCWHANMLREGPGGHWSRPRRER